MNRNLNKASLIEFLTLQAAAAARRGGAHTRAALGPPCSIAVLATGDCSCADVAVRAWGDGLRGDLFSRTDYLGEELVQINRCSGTVGPASGFYRATSGFTRREVSTQQNNMSESRARASSFLYPTNERGIGAPPARLLSSHARHFGPHCPPQRRRIKQDHALTSN